VGTNVRYNGVTIQNCVTREFDQEIMYDQSGSDVIAVRYKLAWEGWIHSQKSNSSGGIGHGIQSDQISPNDGNLHTQFDAVSQRLMASKQGLLVTWNSKTVLAVHAATALLNAGSTDPNMDVENGPKPRGLAVLHVTPGAVKVRFSIECVLSGCASGAGNLRQGPYRIINNRWSISESRDIDFFTTRRITGTIRFAEGLTPKHAFIAAILPGLERGFRREAIEYEASASGLEASYSVVDRQVHYAAPAPATRMDVTHSYSSNDGLTWLDECNVTLHGGPSSDRRALLSRMLQIVDARMEGLRVIQDTDAQYLLESVVITEHFGESNSVNCNIVTKHLGEGTKLILGNILQNKLGRKLTLTNAGGLGPYDPTRSIVPAEHGYDSQGKNRSPAFLFLLTCYYQDPCGTTKHIFGATEPTATPETKSDKSSAPYPVQVESVNLPTGSDEKHTTAHRTAAYTIAKMASRYVTDKMRVMLPLGAPDDQGNTVEVADLAAGATMRIIYYDAERIGAWPSIPSLRDTYQEGNLKGTLLKHVVEPMPPVLSADAQKPVYRVLVKLCYALSRVPNSAKLGVGVLPYTAFRPGDTMFPITAAQSTEIAP
jgi:hypothetical protein